MLKGCNLSCFSILFLFFFFPLQNISSTSKELQKYSISEYNGNQLTLWYFYLFISCAPKINSTSKGVGSGSQEWALSNEKFHISDKAIPKISPKKQSEVDKGMRMHESSLLLVASEFIIYFKSEWKWGCVWFHEYKVKKKCKSKNHLESFRCQHCHLCL